MEASATKKNPAAAFLFAVLFVLFAAGMFSILAGVIAGLLMTGAIMLTIERIPGFWRFAVTGIGTPVVLLGTAYLSHLMFGVSSTMGMIAMVTSLIAKVAAIDHHRNKNIR